MAEKRGRPRIQTNHWDKRYYELSDMRDNKAIKKTIEERLMKAYNDIHLLAFDRDLTWSENNKLRKMLNL